jgi:hypothetical protein
MKDLCESILGKVVTIESSFSIILCVEIVSISPHIIRIQRKQIIATLDTYHYDLSMYSYIGLNRRDYVDLTEPLGGTGRTGYNV